MPAPMHEVLHKYDLDQQRPSAKHAVAIDLVDTRHKRPVIRRDFLGTRSADTTVTFYLYLHVRVRPATEDKSCHFVGLNQNHLRYHFVNTSTWYLQNRKKSARSRLMSTLLRATRLSYPLGLRPVALRHHLTMILPFFDFATGIIP